MSRRDDLMRSYAAQVESYLQNCFLESAPQAQLFEAMRYSLLAGGKRVRGSLTLAFCQLCSGTWEQALPFAAGVEMIHTYSLIHDDLPCMDDDDFRRGMPTNHRVYGEATAVLAGDALLTAAFYELTKAQVPAQRLVQAVRTLSDCAGQMGMVGGQILDMAAEVRECTEEEIRAVQTRKTGALIRAACLLGVIAGGGTEAQERAAATYADAIGLAFQIRDDMLDVIGDAGKLGKATGVDAKKNTFVRLHGIDGCQALVEEETARAIAALSVFEDADFLVAFARALAVRDY